MTKNPDLTIEQAIMLRDLNRSIHRFYQADPFAPNDGLQRAFHAVNMDSLFLKKEFPDMASLLEKECETFEYSTSNAFEGWELALSNLMTALHNFRFSTSNINHFADIRAELADSIESVSEYFVNFDSENGCWVDLPIC